MRILQHVTVEVVTGKPDVREAASGPVDPTVSPAESAEQDIRESIEPTDHE